MAIARWPSHAEDFKRVKDDGIRYDCRVVDFLRDEKGIYGIGFIDQLEAATREINADKTLITRPDRLSDSDTQLAVLQPLFSTRGRSVFGGDYIEETYRRLIHLRMLGGAIREECPLGERKMEWWSYDLAQQAANRRKYHVLKLASLQVVNMLIRGALAVADQGALKQARRFPFSLRYPLYVAGATHFQNMQAIEEMIAIYVKIWCCCRATAGQNRPAST